MITATTNETRHRELGQSNHHFTAPREDVLATVDKLRRKKPDEYAKLERLVELLDRDPTLIDVVTTTLDEIEADNRRGRS